MSVAKKKTSLVDNEADTGEKRPYPKSVFFIIGNEFCERFSYYGMKAILTIYLINYLTMSENNATMIYHVFSMACYFTPLIGAFVSDSFLGKFRTIFYISIVYVAGNIVLSVSAVPDIGIKSGLPLTMLGLGLIAFGTGGIKPCVAAFGGDQFGPGQEKQLARFFSIFYISINAGSLISTFITPVLRADVKCFDSECFTLAFGIPAGLMIIALVLFLIGKPLYKVNPPQGNIVAQVLSCIGHALVNKSKDRQKREHWLDYADDKYDTKLIADIKSVLKVLFLYLPLPFFWALFDQQGSRWTIQATYMDGTITEDFRIQPDQMQVINPLLIVCCIPLFQFVFYPMLSKVRLVRSPLQKMTAGGILAGVAFLVAYFVELKLQGTMPALPGDGLVEVNAINGLPGNCNMTLTHKGQIYSLESNGMEVINGIESGVDIHFGLKTDDGCPFTIKEYNTTFNKMDKNSDNVHTIVFTLLPNDNSTIIQQNDTLAKPKKGQSDVRVFFNFEIKDKDSQNFTLEYKDDKPYGLIPKEGYTDYANIRPERAYKLMLEDDELAGNLNFKPGGRYILYAKNRTEIHMYTTVVPNSVSLFWQIPQYVVLTFGEIMFSITGLEFSYSQAPSSMKSVLQAGWLMTVAFGNLIVVLVASFSILSQANEFLLFAGLMVADMIIFAIMAYFYKTVDNDLNEEQAPELNEKAKIPDSKGQDNPAYLGDTTTEM